jgi:selenophosphate synthetase-related protein
MTNSNTPRIPDSIDIQRLQAMQLVAKMKESADKHGIGFIGGFVAPDGQKFVMTNMNDDDAMTLLPEDLK